MSPTQIEEIKQLLLEAPDSQLDKTAKLLIETWSVPPKAIEILEVLDQIVRYGLSSDFVVQILDRCLKATITQEGTTMEAVVQQAVWRENSI